MSFKFNDSSEWNLDNELRCFVIYKELESKGFPRGLQMKLAEKMASDTKLDVGNISAKISNFKSEAGINSPSNSSEATKFLFKRFGELTLSEARALYAGFKLGQE